PINNRISGLPKDWPTSFGVSTPNNGSTASGISEVNGIGTGSNIHHSAHTTVTPAVIAASADQPISVRTKNKTMASAGASTNKYRLIATNQPFSSASPFPVHFPYVVV